MKLHATLDGQGPKLVVLHGLFGSSRNWQGFIKKFLQPHFQVLALDLRNHGHSAHNPDFDITRMADDVLETMHAYDFQTTHIIGHSLGGKVAMQLALNHPDAIERLVVLDIAPKNYKPSHNQIIKAMLALDLKQFNKRQAIDNALLDAIPETITRQFILQNLERTAAGHYQWRIGLQEIATGYHHVNAALGTPGQRFNGPTLFIRGQLSNYIQSTDMPTISEKFPHASLATIANAGHILHFEAPEKLSQLLLPFLFNHPQT